MLHYISKVMYVCMYVYIDCYVVYLTTTLQHHLRIVQ
jgi:hypothetical protein